MAWWNRRNVRTSSHSLAAQRVDGGADKATGQNTARRSNGRAGAGWQEEAWLYYDALGEVKYAARYVGKAEGKLRPFAAIVPDDEQGTDPIPLDEYGKPGPDGQPSETTPLPAELVAAAHEEVRRLRDEQGGVGQVLQTLGINLFVAGEGYLVGRPEQTTVITDGPDGPVAETTPEQWAAHSVAEVAEVQGKPGVYELKGAPSGQGSALPEGSIVVRVWRPHPKFRNQPDSSMRGALDDCDELLLLKRSIRANAQSRLASAGISAFAQELTFPGQDPTKAGNSAAPDGGDPFTAQVMQAMATAISDPQSAAAAVPIMLRVPAEMIKDKSWHDHAEYHKDADNYGAIALRAELRAALATDLDIPPEVLTGKADVNHWTAWQIDEDTFKGHVEPDAQLIFDAWTTGVFRPGLKETFGDGRYDELIDKMHVWYDAAGLVVRPNRSDDADKAFDRFAISWASYREAKGFNDGDAPSAEELEQRKALAKPVGPQMGGPVSTDSPPADDGPPADQAPPDDSGARAQRLALTAATAGRGGLDHLGARLHRIDTDLRSRLLAAADSSMRRAMTRAGIRVKSSLSGGGPNGNRHGAALAAISGVRPELVCATLGRPLLTAAGIDDETLLTDAFTEFGDQFDRWVSEAQEKARAQLTDSAGLSEEQVAAVKTRHDRDRAAAWSSLSSDLQASAQERIFDPTVPDDDGHGEFSGVMVSLGMIRAAMNLAGGAQSREGASGLGPNGLPLLAGEPPALGVALGFASFDVLADAGVSTETYEWVYGISTRPFEPHLALDGLAFETWDDDVLVNNTGWPEVPYYAPGDHAGCSCDAVPSFVSTADARPEFNPTGEPLDQAASARATT